MSVIAEEKPWKVRRKSKRGGKKMFWGVLFLILGLLILMRVVFGIDLPIFKSLIGIGLIYLGVRVITSGSWETKINGERLQSKATANQTIFTQNVFDPELLKTEGEPKFSNVFGSSALNLKEIPAEDRTLRLENVFGAVKVETSPDTKLRIKARPIFGSVKVRGEKFGGFVAEIDREFKGQGGQGPTLTLEIESVFGAVDIR